MAGGAGKDAVTGSLRLSGVACVRLRAMLASHHTVSDSQCRYTGTQRDMRLQLIEPQMHSVWTTATRGGPRCKHLPRAANTGRGAGLTQGLQAFPGTSALSLVAW